MPIPVIALIGPTAVGKTALSLDLARDINGEIISVDSRQVYRYMDIGTDKIDPLTRREILHHLIDVTDPDQIFSASDFADLGRKAIKSIISRGKVPILAGGTPFYYRALLDDSLNIPVPSDEKIREELSSLGDGEEGNELRHEILQDLDMERASRIHKNDKLRVIRAIEICKVTGKPMSLWMKERPSENRDYDTLYLGLTRSKEDLLKIIESRVRRQFSSGYPEEVKWLLSKGFSGDLPSMKGFGYRELVRYFSKEITLDQAIESDIVSTRQFAKRQMTWFRKFPKVHWRDLSENSYNEALSSMICLSRRHVDSGGDQPRRQS